MAKFIKKLLDHATERTLKGCEVGQVDGIILMDSRKRGEGFKTTIEMPCTCFNSTTLADMPWLSVIFPES
jgi:hypothetical protein